MAINSVFAPFSYFTDATGQALEDGFIYIGLEFQEARSSPKQAFFDKLLSIPTGPFIRTRAGVPINNSGAPTAIYVDGEFSMTVTDRNGVVVYSTLRTTIAVQEGGSTAAPVRWSNGTLGNVGGGFASEPSTGFVRPGTGVLQTSVQGILATQANTDNFWSVLPFRRSISANLPAGANSQGSAAISNDFTVINTAAANPSGVTLPFFASDAGRRVAIVNRGANPVNIYPDSSDTIGTLGVGVPWLLLPGASVGFIRRDATRWEVLGVSGLATSGTISLAGASTNIATNLDIFAPTRITVWVRGASITAAGYGGIQLGTGGAFVTTGYGRAVSSNRTADITSTTQFIDIGSNNLSTTTWDVRYDLRLVVGTTLWQCNITGGSSAGFAFSGSGVITLAGVIDRIRYTTTGGTFNAGSVLAEWS
jgi:hypothetical protein